MNKFLCILSFSLILFSFEFINAQNPLDKWVPTSLNSGQINCLDTTAVGLFAGTYGNGIYLTTDRGANWNQKNNGLTGAALYINTLTVCGSTIIAGTNGRGIYISTNNGGSWQASNVGMVFSQVDSVINALAVSGSNIYAGTNNGVFLSTNNGAHWAAANTGIANFWVYSLAVSGSNIFAGAFNTNSQMGGVFLSTNNGQSWTGKSSGLPSNPLHIVSMTAIGSNIYAGVENVGVYLSTNNGTKWTMAAIGMPDFTNVMAYSKYGTKVVAGTSSGVFITLDNGGSWVEMDNGLSDILANNVYSILVNGDSLYAGTYEWGVWKGAISMKVNEIVNAKGELKIYPNPATNYVNISSIKPHVSNLTDKYVLTIRNIEGQEVVTKNIQITDTYKLDISNLINGIYFLTLQNDKENHESKIVIQK